MPCYRCGARQTDPARGPSPWKRGVRAGEQVLVCPDCQQVHDWAADLESCPACGSVRLSRALGQTRCSACGHTTDGEGSPPASRAPAGDDESGPGTTSNDQNGPGPARSDLGSEVDAAIGRLLHRDTQV